MLKPDVDETRESAYFSISEAKPSMLSLSVFSPTQRSIERPRRSFPADRPGKGGITLGAKSFIRIGNVSVTRLRADQWQLRYRNGAGQDVRRRLTGLSEREAREVALHIGRELLADAGFIPGKRPVALGIGEALAGAIRSRNTRPATTAGRAYYAEHFTRWLAKNHLPIKTWDQIRPAMVQEYVIGWERRGLSYNSVRLALAPILLAARYMADNYPETCRPMPRIKLTPAPPREIQCLEAHELAALLDWLLEHSPDFYAMACLQALAGLRVLEVSALRVQDVNLMAGTVCVCDTGYHKPKTVSSWRTLPVCGEAMKALRAIIEGHKVRPVTGEIFINAHGALWTRTAISLRWRRTLRRAAREKELPRLRQIPAKGLRRAFATLASRLGSPDRLLKAYLGHTAGDMLGIHYRRIDVTELRAVSTRMDAWRKAIQQGQDGNILAIVGGDNPQMPELTEVAEV